jgi:replication-associated recombination protein RarA
MVDDKASKNSKDQDKKPQRIGGFELRVVGDYQFDEVASALQKMIRRNREYEACYWAMILHKSGYYKYVWKRLAVIASEDIGTANPMAPIVVNALRGNYDMAIDSQSRQKDDAQLFIFQAVTYLCRSTKLREIDNLNNLLIGEYESGIRLEIPEVAIDPHTTIGKAKYGRWDSGTTEEKLKRKEKWYNEWSLVEPRAEESDKYIERLRKFEASK